MSSGWEFKNNGNDIPAWIWLIGLIICLAIVVTTCSGCASKVVVKNCKPGVPFKVLADVETLDLDTADFICEEL